MSQTMNSRHFTCALLEKDLALVEPLTILTLRHVSFPHTLVILTHTELIELQSLIQSWRSTLKRQEA